MIKFLTNKKSNIKIILGTQTMKQYPQKFKEANANLDKQLEKLERLKQILEIIPNIINNLNLEGENNEKTKINPIEKNQNNITIENKTTMNHNMMIILLR